MAGTMAQLPSLSFLRLLLATAAVTVLFAQPAPLAAGQRGARARGGAGVGITVYEDENFRGRSATFRNDVPDLGRAAGMNDRITSLRIPRGESWEVCENNNYGGRCQVFSASTANVGRGWNDRISSLRRVRGNGGGGFRPPMPGPGGRGRIVLFSERGFRGRSVSVSGSESYLAAFNDRAQSVQVFGGAWQLCEDSEFRGRCVTVSSNVADLGSLRGKVSSARPLARGR